MSNCVISPLPDDDLVLKSSDKLKERKASFENTAQESYVTVNRKNINKFSNQPQLPKRENSAEYNFLETDAHDALAKNKKHEILTRNDTWKE